MDVEDVDIWIFTLDKLMMKVSTKKSMQVIKMRRVIERMRGCKKK